VVITVQFCEYTKDHWLKHFKWLNQWILWDVNWFHWGLY
jgi:hypothetical protein